jgi:hypothetical protein
MRLDSGSREAIGDRADAVSGTRDFWLSSGHHLLDRGGDGGLVVTDDFLKAYLARPELMPPPEACVAERTIHASLLSDPRRSIARSQLAAIADPDARENWGFLISWRDHLLREATLEAAYLAIVRNGLAFPPLFLDHLVQLILRNLLNECEDAFVLRAAELFFRSQQLATLEGTLLARDSEAVLRAPSQRPALLPLPGFGVTSDIEVLGDQNAGTYWQRSDAFDMALDLTSGRRGLIALGQVATQWIRHLLGLDVTIEAVTELRDARLTWYVGLDSQGTRIGNALWHGEQISEITRELVVGLYRLTFAEEAAVLETARGSPTYLITAASPNGVLRMKPQNLIAGLPLGKSRREAH